jgi:hypothetical protein
MSLTKTVANGFNYTGTWQSVIAGTTNGGTLTAQATTVNSSLFQLRLGFTVTTTAECNGTFGQSSGSFFRQDSITDGAMSITWTTTTCASVLRLPANGVLNLARQ